MILLVSVELVDGKPDLQLPASVNVDVEGDRVLVYWRDNILLLDKLGVLGGKLRFLCHGGKNVIDKLSHLGANVQRMRDVVPTLTQAQHDWLVARGLRAVRKNGAIIGYHPRLVIAGHDPLSLVTADADLQDGDVVTMDPVA